jgi:hypothetical protein
MSKSKLDNAYEAGSRDAAEETNRSSITWSNEERRAYNDGYYHALGQKHHNKNQYDGFVIGPWLGTNFKEDQADLDAYNAGHEAARKSGSRSTAPSMEETEEEDNEDDEGTPTQHRDVEDQDDSAVSTGNWSGYIIFGAVIIGLVILVSAINNSNVPKHNPVASQPPQPHVVRQSPPQTSPPVVRQSQSSAPPARPQTPPGQFTCRAGGAMWFCNVGQRCGAGTCI